MQVPDELPATRVRPGPGFQSVAELRVWDVASGRTTRGLVEPTGWIAALAFARDGLTLIAGGGTPGTPGFGTLFDLAPRPVAAAPPAAFLTQDRISTLPLKGSTTRPFRGWSRAPDRVTRTHLGRPAQDWKSMAGRPNCDDIGCSLAIWTQARPRWEPPLPGPAQSRTKPARN